MHVVTFYSYKGGVGRTMALANVAYLLAQAGQRVLVVDFDLEAPGLSSYVGFCDAETRPGIVDYVHSYLETKEAPDVAEYISACDISEVRLWHMGAGRHREAGYPAAFAAIDWSDLYDRREGFLLFEDLKQQWALHEGSGFDYVLIDSRTGHTDIGGICTRQLPDAVVVMFVPTPQNIEGLTPILQAIRREKMPVRGSTVELLFCPSNVPDLDDQELILANLLAKSKEQLKYVTAAALIQHYDSLDLLQQPIYAATHPGTRLVRQYGELYGSIISGNPRDRAGALIVLEGLPRRYDMARQSNDEKELNAIDAAARQIRANFPEDGEIAYLLAALYNKMIQPKDELAALNVTISSGDAPKFARLQRARVQIGLGAIDDAVGDLTSLLGSDELTLFEVRPVVDILRSLIPTKWKQEVKQTIVGGRVDGTAKATLLQALLDDRTEAGAVAQLADRIIAHSNDPEERRLIGNTRLLALIAAGDFKKAKKSVAASRSELAQRSDIGDTFNYAMAEWGDTGQPPRDLFEQVLKLRTKSNNRDANMHQCIAMSLIGIGNQADALASIASSLAAAEGEERMFSCWRYLYVDREEMKRDLNDMVAAARKGPPEPPFFTIKKVVAKGLR